MQGGWPSKSSDHKKGKAHFNPEAVERLKGAAFVEAIFTKYARNLDELIALRSRILAATKFDFFNSWPQISENLVKRADAILKRRHGAREDIDGE
jgi:hypothetical protein